HAGLVYWVWLMTPSASVKQTSLRSKSTAAAASSKTARNAGLCSYKSAPMPACWLPWPAKTNATFMVFSFSALQLPCQPFHLAEAGFAAVHQAGEDLGHRADVVQHAGDLAGHQAAGVGVAVKHGAAQAAKRELFKFHLVGAGLLLADILARSEERRVGKMWRIG